VAKAITGSPFKEKKKKKKKRKERGKREMEKQKRKRRKEKADGQCPISCTVLTPRLANNFTCGTTVNGAAHLL